MNHNKQIGSEQSAFEKAWALLTEPAYAELRSHLFTTQEELSCFRQLLIKAVTTANISDHEPERTRVVPWKEPTSCAIERCHLGTASTHKATFLYELIVQATNSCHAMQDFSIYKKWNQLLLAELSLAYSSRRICSDPMKTWYETQLSFFDKQIIPLATKLRDCQIYGSSSDEFLENALENRSKWKCQGKRIVEELKWQRGSSPTACKDKPVRVSKSVAKRIKNHRRQSHKPSLRLPLPPVLEDTAVGYAESMRDDYQSEVSELTDFDGSSISSWEGSSVNNDMKPTSKGGAACTTSASRYPLPIENSSKSPVATDSAGGIPSIANHAISGDRANTSAAHILCLPQEDVPKTDSTSPPAGEKVGTLQPSDTAPKLPSRSGAGSLSSEKQLDTRKHQGVGRPIRSALYDPRQDS